MTIENFEHLKVAIIGTCQVVGLAAAARHFLPGAEVKCWHVGAHPTDSDEDLLTQLPDFDVVVSQLSDLDEHIALRITRLRERGLPVVYQPPLVFTGFHPDITYIRSKGGIVHGVETDYHSVIIASAFTLGLPEWRVPELFNAYIFAELGYFDVFSAAKTALFANFDEHCIDLRPLFDLWVRLAGQFMYTINHPHIVALSTLCRLALVQAGILDPAAALPEGVDDSLGRHFVWPTYPALAERIGIQGTTTFLRRACGPADGQTRALPLINYVSACYRIYADLGEDTLRVGAVAAACERLSALVVR